MLASCMLDLHDIIDEIKLLKHQSEIPQVCPQVLGVQTVLYSVMVAKKCVEFLDSFEFVHMLETTHRVIVVSPFCQVEWK
jgi:hypothetical protein